MVTLSIDDQEEITDLMQMMLKSFIAVSFLVITSITNLDIKVHRYAATGVHTAARNTVKSVILSCLAIPFPMYHRLERAPYSV